jgi:hypothetical protein
MMTNHLQLMPQLWLHRTINPIQSHISMPCTGKSLSYFILIWRDKMLRGKGKRTVHITVLFYTKFIMWSNSPTVNIVCTQTKDLPHKSHTTVNSQPLTDRQAKMFPNVMMFSIFETQNKKFVLFLNSRRHRTNTLDYTSINWIFLCTQ